MRKFVLLFTALFSCVSFAQAQDIDMMDEVLTFDEATGTAKIGVIVKNKNASATTVDVALMSNFGTTDNSDITLTTTKLTFAATSPDPDTQYINVTVANDMTAEAAEYFALQISNAVNGSIGDDVTVVYIKDNDYTPPVARKNISLDFLGRYTMPAAGSSAEILAYDSASNRLFVVNSLKSVLQILDFSNPAALTKVDSVDMSSYGGGIQSVDVYNGMVAVAVQGNPKTDSGSVVFMDKDGTVLKQFKTGFLPDNVDFTHDGKYVLTANEGEPNDAYSIDPEGSVTVIDISNGLNSATVKHATFTSFNASAAALKAKGIRIFGANNPTVAQDMEPEYIAFNSTSDTAYVTLQENNAVAIVHIPSATIVDIMPLGYVDHSAAGNALDASDKTDEPLIANWPVRGLMLPDALGSYEVGGKTYIVVANEGDSRDYGGYSEELRIKDKSLKLDATKFPAGSLMKKDFCMGRLNITTSLGDTDNDGDYDELYSYGTRGFAIFNTAARSLVYQSGDQFEHILAVDPKVGKIFNASNDNNDLKDRSDNKGPEPEGVTMGTIHDTTYAFIGCERIGGVMVYDVTTPAAPVFVDYINTRDTNAYGGDNGPEGLIFLDAAHNSHGKYYLITANEVSGTVAVFEVKVAPVSVQDVANKLPKLNVYPNPVIKGQLYFSTTVTGTIVDMNGRAVASFSNANSISTTNLASGVYFLKANGFSVEKVIVQ
ncbi:MAG: T9SS type A sorting domain-containing protein [Chitinophagales bacterium]|nr:T9SS type A sorting domain-containing protein [Chitinophagales bacterium]